MAINGEILDSRSDALSDQQFANGLRLSPGTDEVAAPTWHPCWPHQKEDPAVVTRRSLQSKEDGKTSPSNLAYLVWATAVSAILPVL